MIGTHEVLFAFDLMKAARRLAFCVLVQMPLVRSRIDDRGEFEADNPYT